MIYIKEACRLLSGSLNNDIICIKKSIIKNYNLSLERPTAVRQCASYIADLIYDKKYSLYRRMDDRDFDILGENLLKQIEKECQISSVK